MNEMAAVEYGPNGAGLFVVRGVIDAIQHCNLRCLYCHPGLVWMKQHVKVDLIANALQAAERHGVLEMVLSGGEITIHPEFDAILDATHSLQKMATSFVTNATVITDAMAEKIRRSNITRVCVSLDGPDDEIHNSARGKNFHKVIDGLKHLQQVGREITIISVAHQKNFRSLVDLSYMLVETKLANQHHMCAPSYSGTAREYYDELKLQYDDYIILQDAIDKAHKDLNAKGLFVTFNSFWPGTGLRSQVDSGRTYTLQQLVEQTKDSYIIIRSNGDFRLTFASWGRETVGNAVIGNIHHDDIASLFAHAEQLYRDGKVKQLPREVEALHKFQLGKDADRRSSDAIIDTNDDPTQLAKMIPIVPLSQSSLFQNPVDWSELSAIVAAAKSGTMNYRFVKHGSGVYILFNPIKSHVTLLTAAEWQRFVELYQHAEVVDSAIAG